MPVLFLLHIGFIDSLFLELPKKESALVTFLSYARLIRFSASLSFRWGGATPILGWYVFQVFYIKVKIPQYIWRYLVCCSKENPAASCQEIYTKDAKAVSGAYWIKGKVRPFQVSIRLTGQTFCWNCNFHCQAFCDYNWLVYRPNWRLVAWRET